MEEMNNVIAPRTMNEAVLSHPRAKSLNRLLSRELSVADKRVEQQYIGKHLRLLERRFGELQASGQCQRQRVAVAIFRGKRRRMRCRLCHPTA